MPNNFYFQHAFSQEPHDTGDTILCVLIFIILVLLKAAFSEAVAPDLTIPFLRWDTFLIFSLKKTVAFYTNCSRAFNRVSPVKEQCSVEKSP